MEAEKHASEDTLESYSRGRLPDAEVEALEEHLLVCPRCQDKLTEVDAYVRAARRAAANFQMEPAPSLEGRWRDLWRWAIHPMPLATAGVLALLLAAIAVTWRSAGRSEPVYSVYLQAVRGGEPLLGAHAPAGHPLHFRLDPGGLVPAEQYHLEIADARGSNVFETTARRKPGEITAEVTKPLVAGSYWVRIYEPGKERALLREFGLTIQ